MSPQGGFEVLRFEAVPATEGVAVVELAGTFDGPPPRRPRLLVERAGRSVEMPAIAVTAEPWSAAFAVEADAPGDERTAFSLVQGRGPDIALPAPTIAGTDKDRYVRMARAANELRHRINEHAEATAAAEQRLEEASAERDRLRDDLAEAGAELEAARRRADDAERSATACRDQRTSAVDELDRVREALAAEQQRAALAEDEVRASRRELRDVRAQLETLRRERRPQPAGRRGHEVPDAGDDTLAIEATPPAAAATAESETETATLEAPPAAPPRPKRTIRISEQGDEPLAPEAVGARYIEPAERHGPLLTPARIVAGLALLLLVLALVAILLGAGLV